MCISFDTDCNAWWHAIRIITILSVSPALYINEIEEKSGQMVQTVWCCSMWHRTVVVCKTTPGTHVQALDETEYLRAHCSHSKQKVGQSWSKLVALGHRAKLVTNGQVTNCELHVQLVNWAICLWYLEISHTTYCDQFCLLHLVKWPITKGTSRSRGRRLRMARAKKASDRYQWK